MPVKLNGKKHQWYFIRLNPFLLLLPLLGCSHTDEIGIACEEGVDEVYTISAWEPTFPGCGYDNDQCSDDKLLEFINSYLVYPARAKRYKIEGSVAVEFVVEKSGCISRKQIIGSLGFGCDEEALRLIGMMPLWLPGKNDDGKSLVGVPVRVRSVLLINFDLP